MQNSTKILAFVFCALCFIATHKVAAQAITNQLYQSYDDFRESALDQRRFKHKDIQPLINRVKSNPAYTVKVVGYSIEGRSLSLISVGSGPIDVFLWSQMHGDESTATMAIFDIINLLESGQFKREKAQLLSKVRLHFLPMLNPDGAERFRRRNALGIDINRDALRLQSPEGQTLKRIRDSLDADFGFNLHDQSRYTNAYLTEKTATISYLAPAYDYPKSINQVRKNAMLVIGLMNKVIQQYAPGQVGRYNDAFEPRAFGDNLQKWGTSTILIESGGYPGDREKQEIRKLNFVSIMTAIFAIGDKSYLRESLKAYESIPGNDRKLFDVKIQGLNYPLLGKDYLLDVAINHFEIDENEHESFYYRGGVVDQGDLSNYYAYEELDAKGLRLSPGKVFPETIANLGDVRRLNLAALIKKGYTYLRVRQLDPQLNYAAFPINLVSENFKVPELGHGVVPSTFLLSDGANPIYAVINGFVVNLQEAKPEVPNALIYRN